MRLTIHETDEITFHSVVRKGPLWHAAFQYMWQHENGNAYTTMLRETGDTAQQAIDQVWAFKEQKISEGKRAREKMLEQQARFKSNLSRTGSAGQAPLPDLEIGDLDLSGLEF